jgi:DNA-binding protein
MEETQVQTDLFCIHCRDDVLHIITYLNNHISKIECKSCGKQINSNIDISHELYEELVERVLSKPSRMKEEFHAHMVEFILSLPGRLTSKPIRIFREAKSIKTYINKYKKRKK